jgi:hypothetical protein
MDASRTGQEAASGSRASRFLGRIDAFLPSLGSDRARRLFLDRQLQTWECRYSRFIASEGASEIALDRADPPQAADLLLTIAGLACRRGALTHTLGDARMPHLDRRQRMERVLRNLLVCADQRCPAIIGQAHVLYHDAIGGSPSTPEQQLNDLRREAEDLLSAIREVDAEMNAARSAR